MPWSHALTNLKVGVMAAGIALLFGCAGPPAAPQAPARVQPSPPPAAAAPAIQKFQQDLGEGLVLDYQVEQKHSTIRQTHCFALISGQLSNLSGKALSKRSVLDIAVLSHGKQLFRDNTSPLADIPSGSHAAFEMVVSPLFADGCPLFDKFNIAVRKVLL